MPNDKRKKGIMQAVKNDQKTIRQTSSGRFTLVGIIIIIVLTIGLYINNTARAIQATSASEKRTLISQTTLEQEYGLRLNLIALTAASGMLDVRLTITDGEKAKELLSDQANFPSLITSKGIQLKTSPDTTSEEIKFEKGNMLFLLYPNSQNMVKPGDPVSLVLGKLQVETVPVN
jgi:hypothetical protein